MLLKPSGTQHPLTALTITIRLHRKALESTYEQVINNICYITNSNYSLTFHLHTLQYSASNFRYSLDCIFSALSWCVSMSDNSAEWRPTGKMTLKSRTFSNFCSLENTLKRNKNPQRQRIQLQMALKTEHTKDNWQSPFDKCWRRYNIWN